MSAKLTPGQMLQIRKTARMDAAEAGEGWRALSATLSSSAQVRSGSLAISVLVAPGATKNVDPNGAPPGYWMKDASRIVIDGDVLGKDPAELSPILDPEDFKKLSALHGVFIHEVGHAMHTDSDCWADFDPDEAEIFAICRLLEEIRMEAKVVEARPQDARFLRATARQIILDEPTVKQLTDHAAMGLPGLVRAVADLATLLEGRQEAGSLEKTDLRRVSAQIDAALSAEVRKGLKDIWQETTQLDDGDIDGLKSLAERYKELVAEESSSGGCPLKLMIKIKMDSQSKDDGVGGGPSSPQGIGSTSDDGPKEGQGDGKEGESDEDGDSGGESGLGNEASEELFGEILSDGEEDLDEAGGEADEEISGDKKAGSEVEALAENAIAQQQINEGEEARRRQMSGIAAKPNEVRGGRSTSGSGGTDALVGERQPSPEERQARNLLTRKLRKARWRDRDVVRRARPLPPGRLHSREALRGDAERSLGKMASARPWKHKKRLQTEMPKVSAALILDSSGSMYYSSEQISGAVWILAHAINDIDGQVVSTTYGMTRADIVVPAGKPPRFVPQYQGAGDIEGFDKCIALAEKELGWDHVETTKLLVMITDGVWNDTPAADKRIERLMERGVKVLMINIGHDPMEHPADETCVIEEPIEIATIVGDAAIKILQQHKPKVPAA